jgi:hypothetical protein
MPTDFMAILRMGPTENGGTLKVYLKTRVAAGGSASFIGSHRQLVCNLAAFISGQASSSGSSSASPGSPGRRPEAKEVASAILAEVGTVVLEGPK